MKITEHFSLVEFTQSDTAESKGIDNTPDEKTIENIKHLCIEVLEPLRRYVDQPVVISSGYRSKALNKAVGGVRNSQHMTGEAADIKGNKDQLREWMAWIMDNCRFDQLILEHNKAGLYWIHVSYSTKHNRQCVISSILKK